MSLTLRIVCITALASRLGNHPWDLSLKQESSPFDVSAAAPAVTGTDSSSYACDCSSLFSRQFQERNEAPAMVASHWFTSVIHAEGILGAFPKAYAKAGTWLATILARAPEARLSMEQGSISKLDAGPALGADAS